MCDEMTDGCEDCERLVEMISVLTAERDALRARVAGLEALSRNVARGILDGPVIVGPPMTVFDPPRPRTEVRP